MTLWTPPQQFSLYESNLTAPADGAMGTVVTAGTPAHTKNATYTQLIASTAFDCYWIEIVMSEVFAVGTDTGTLVDIAIGAASAEQVIIPNLNAGFAAIINSGTAGTSGGQVYAFPLYIPAGSRLSATSQAVVASDTVRVWVKLYGGPKTPVWAGQQVVDYGTVAGSSSGTAVAAGVSGAEGTFTQIVAATTQDHFFFSAGLAGDDSSIPASLLFLDVGIGAATEAVIMENQLYSNTSAEAIEQKQPVTIWTPVPSGTRLAARISQTSATAANYDVILYGVS